MWVFKIKISVGVSLRDHRVTDLDYADDIALLTENEADMQFFVDRIVHFGGMIGPVNQS